MSEKLGPVLYGKDTDEVFLGMDYSHSKNYSETYATTIDDEIKRIMTECYQKCENILTVHNDKLTLIAETLIENEKISGELFLKLMDENYNPEEDTAEEIVEEVVEETTEEKADNFENVADDATTEAEEKSAE